MVVVAPCFPTTFNEISHTKFCEILSHIKLVNTLNTVNAANRVNTVITVNTADTVDTSVPSASSGQFLSIFLVRALLRSFFLSGPDVH